MNTLKISRRASDRLRAGHLWVYKTDLESNTSTIPPGALVTLTDSRSLPLGTALYSSASMISARLISRSPALTRPKYINDLRSRIESALHLRSVVAPHTHALRLIFAESDNLPGIIADRYQNLVILQLLTQGTAQDDVREILVETLRKNLSPNGEDLTIWERPDPRIRELEQLAAPAPGPLFTTSTEDSTPTQTIFTLNDIRFEYDVAAGQKTGAFLDQRLNYAAAAAHVKASGKTHSALDICTYHGGFALHLAQVCSQVTGLDASRSALESADRNLALNPNIAHTCELEWIEADAFDYLRHLDNTHTAKPSPETTFDAIVLDPPAFAKSKRAAESALRGYKELNLRALRLISTGGTLITHSCSHHVSLQDFTEVVASAAADANRRIQLLETRAAAPDHPEILTLPETRYLKSLICRVD
jgi:23S rRNA (cytosine1962-C5)-methyltransferase